MYVIFCVVSVLHPRRPLEHIKFGEGLYHGVQCSLSLVSNLKILKTKMYKKIIYLLFYTYMKIDLLQTAKDIN